MVNSFVLSCIFYRESLMNEKKTFLCKCKNQMISIYAGHCILKDNRQKIKFKVSEVIVVVAEHDRDNSGIWIQYILPHGSFYMSSENTIRFKLSMQHIYQQCFSS